MSYRPRPTEQVPLEEVSEFLAFGFADLLNATSWKTRSSQFWVEAGSDEFASQTSLRLGKRVKLLPQFHYPARFATPALLGSSAPTGGLCDPGRLRSPALASGSHRFREATFDVLGILSPAMEIGRLFAELEARGVQLARTLVNIGAGNGQCVESDLATYDPANCLLQSEVWGFSGVMVEASPRHWRDLASLAEGLPPGALQLLKLEVSPATVLDLCNAALRRMAAAAPRAAAAAAPGGVRAGRASGRELDLLKVDIDGEDYGIVSSLVRIGGWRPKVIHVEVDPFVPPPFAYRQVGPRRGTFVTSLSAFVELLAPLYALVQLEFLNALFVRRDLADRVFPDHRQHTVEEKWAAGFFCHPLRSMWGQGEPRVQLRAGLDMRAVADGSMAPVHVRAAWMLRAMRRLDFRPAEVSPEVLDRPNATDEVRFVLDFPPESLSDAERGMRQE